MIQQLKRVAAAIAIASAAIVPATSHAQMTLNAAGTALGLTLTTFADGFPVNGGGVGPIGAAFVGGTVLVSDYTAGAIRVFPTGTDGQHVSDAGVVTMSGYGSGNPAGMVQSGGNIYMAMQASGSLVRVNADGSFHSTTMTGLPAATGAATNPANGHVFVTTLGFGVIWDVDTVALTKTPFVFASSDGITFSPDGSILYAEVGSHIIGYSVASGLPVFDSGLIAGGADGAAAGTGTLAGKIFVATNSGDLVMVDALTSTQTLIGTGGSRGDLVTVDPTNGSLLISQSDRMLRLIPGEGGSFVETPEPASLAVLGSGMALLFRFRRRR